MLRAWLIALSLLVPATIPVVAAAQQSGLSVNPAPKNEHAWRRAVQLRIVANLENILQARRAVGSGQQNVQGTLYVVIAADGTIREVRMKDETGSGADDESLVRAMSALPKMPPFSPDMQREQITVLLPVKLARS